MCSFIRLVSMCSAHTHEFCILLSKSPSYNNTVLLQRICDKNVTNLCTGMNKL